MARLFWIVLVLMMADYLAMALWSMPVIMHAAQGLVPFDLRPFGYDGAQARAFLAALGPEGRGFYLHVQQGFDTAYPALLAVVLSLAFTWLYRMPWRLILAAVAIAGAGFDYAENLAVAPLLRAGPAGVSDAMVAQASRWTTLKFGFDGLAVGALFLGLGMALWRRHNSGGQHGRD